MIEYPWHFVDTPEGSCLTNAAKGYFFFFFFAKVYFKFSLASKDPKQASED